jgi:hypothetical protein
VKHIGLFIDLDNAQLEAANHEFTRCHTSALWAGALIAELERVGEGVVSVRRAYGDALLNAGRVFHEKIWNPKEIRDEIIADVYFQTDLFFNGFQMIHCPTVGGKKNRADILMALDCMELASSTSPVDTFAVVSQDSDFSSLLHRLRALGKEVIFITVGKPKGQSWRALEALSAKWIVYDQSVIDRSGFEPFKELVNTLQETDADALGQGIPLPAIQARIEQHCPTFTHEAVGFRQFADFVEACVEDLPLVCKNNTLRLKQETPLVKIPASSTSIQPATADPSPPTREQQLTGLLSKQNLRPVAELRREIGRWLRDEIDNDRPGLFDADGSPKEPLAYSDLNSRIQERFKSTASKSRINDAMRILSMSRVVRLDRSGGWPIRNSPIKSLAAPEVARTLIVSFLVRRLLGTGEVFTDADVRPLTNVIFGASDDELLRITKEGLELAKSKEETNDSADAGMEAAVSDPAGTSPSLQPWPASTGIGGTAANEGAANLLRSPD